VWTGQVLLVTSLGQGNGGMNINSGKDNFFSVSLNFLFCSLFKSATGYTVKEYITARRMMFAKQLLLHNESVSQVMEKVGYNNYSRFIQVFKKYVGVTPKQYLKKQ
jgi:YesN/AraC family two-component response regulator